MRNEVNWKETKFTRDRRGRWRASRSEVPIMSRLVADLAVAAYQDVIEKHATGRLADLGCGNVPLYGIYKNRVTGTLCVDWPESRHEAAHVDIFADLNSPLDLEPDSFDTVLATDVLEHLNSPKTFFASTARILRPGGKIIIGVPFLYWIHEAPHDYYRYTRFALKKLAVDAGLEILSLTAYAGSPEVLSDIAVKSVGTRFGLAWFIYWLTKILLVLPPIKLLSAVKRDTMPMGYVFVAQKPTLDLNVNDRVVLPLKSGPT
jgi:SAM-dependent methyltransferase